ncbi:hypothetical protein [Aureimonas sp. AU20]|uniref:hypothetical protein n=1 Tax=Aureimonas sp. AU20 TaxID=1349819 RepID=UPI00071F40F8|nr:hypothetical protein [Aureimonas sp. AU20]ALN74399.1 hypothetical protein M673_16850 [Aureimonas sp. AU20]
MSKTRTPPLDDASTGGGIGDIGRQPLDPSSENAGNAEPVLHPEDDAPGAGLTRDEDVTPSDEDPDADADETLGTVV